MSESVGAAHTWRSFVEVFVQAWRTDEGSLTPTKQPAEKGSRRGVILSRLVNH